MCRKKNLAFASAVFLICLQVKSFGCSCGETPHPCEEFNKGRVIFIGHVIEKSKELANEKESRTIKVKVDEGVRGVEKGEVLNFAMLGFCSDRLLPGVAYLVYADKYENGLYDISICSRTRPLPKGESDLAFLRNLDKVKQASVFGRAEAYFKREGENLGITRMIPSVQIKVFNDSHSFVRKTDESGLYEITDIPPGKYQVEAIVPEGYKWRENYGRHKEEIYLIDKGCSEFDVFISPFDEAIKKRLEVEDRASNPPRILTLPLISLTISSFVVVALLLLLFVKIR